MKFHFLFILTLLLVSIGIQAECTETKPLRSHRDIQSSDISKFHLAAKKCVLVYESSYASQDAYCAAQFYTQAKEFSEALKWLGKFLEKKPNEISRIEKEAVFKELHPLILWTSLIEKTKINIEKQKKLWESPVWGTQYKETLTETEKIAGLSKLWSEVKFNFAFTNKLIELNWDALYFKYLEEIRNVENTHAYYKKLSEMLAILKDGHTLVFPPNEINDKFGTSPLIKAKLIDSKLIVTAVGDDYLNKHGLVPGVEIIRANDLPIKEYVHHNYYPYISSPTIQDFNTRVYENKFLKGNLLEPIKIDFIDFENKTISLNVHRVTNEKFNDFSGAYSEYTFKKIERNISYIEVTTFQNLDLFSIYMKDFSKIKQSDGLIFDLRRNGGGSGDVAFKFLSTLIGKPYKTPASKTRQYLSSSRANEQNNDFYYFPQNFKQPNQANQFKGEIIVLISAKTFSAAEDFVASFKMLNRGILIGETTAGSTGNPLEITLPGGGGALIVSKHDFLPNGEEFVGVGIKPDIEILSKLEDIKAGKDTVLTFALDAMNKRLIGNFRDIKH